MKVRSALAIVLGVMAALAHGAPISQMSTNPVTLNSAIQPAPARAPMPVLERIVANPVRGVPAVERIAANPAHASRNIMMLQLQPQPQPQQQQQQQQHLQQLQRVQRVQAGDMEDGFDGQLMIEEGFDHETAAKHGFFDTDGYYYEPVLADRQQQLQQQHEGDAETEEMLEGEPMYVYEGEADGEGDGETEGDVVYFYEDVGDDQGEADQVQQQAHEQEQTQEHEMEGEGEAEEPEHEGEVDQEHDQEQELEGEPKEEKKTLKTQGADEPCDRKRQCKAGLRCGHSGLHRCHCVREHMWNIGLTTCNL